MRIVTIGARPVESLFGGTPYGSPTMPMRRSMLVPQRSLLLTCRTRNTNGACAVHGRHQKRPELLRMLQAVCRTVDSSLMVGQIDATIDSDFLPAIGVVDDRV